MTIRAVGGGPQLAERERVLFDAFGAFDARFEDDEDELREIPWPRRPSPGKVSRTSRMAPAVQLAAAAPAVPRDAARMRALAERGVGGASGRLPFIDVIAGAFGHHDVSGVRVAIGGDAAAANHEMGASAYAAGESIAFASAPDLRLAAHEAAHVVQQRASVSLDGGVGTPGDAYERHADQVAERVVRGESAEALLDAMSGASGAGAARAGGDAVQCEQPHGQAPAASSYSVSMDERRRFEREFHHVEDFIPPSHLGGFDAMYTTSSRELTIVCRCAFEFLTEGQPWSEPEMRRFRDRFLLQCSLDWSARHTFWCQRDWWEDLVANVVTHFISDDRRAHFRVRVQRSPIRSNVRRPYRTGDPAPGVIDPWTNEQGPAVRDWSPGQVELNADDVNDRNVDGTNHQRTSVHEGGHMIGLGDDYVGANSPPEHSDAAEEETGRPVVVANDGRVMSHGMSIGRQDGVTFLAALRAATHMQEWSFDRKAPAPRPAENAGDHPAPAADPRPA